MQFKPKINRAVQRTFMDHNISRHVYRFNGKEKSDEMVDSQKFWSERHGQWMRRGEWRDLGVNKELWMAQNNSYYANRCSSDFDSSDPHDM